jgi:hypothetical protein
MNCEIVMWPDVVLACGSERAWFISVLMYFTLLFQRLWVGITVDSPLSFAMLSVRLHWSLTNLIVGIIALSMLSARAWLLEQAALSRSPLSL